MGRMDTKETMKRARGLLSALMVSQGVDPVLSVATLEVLVYIGLNPQCASADIIKDLGLAQPAVTRHLQRLGQGSQGSAAVGRGLGLIEYIDDPMDARRRLYSLNNEGRVTLYALVAGFP